MSAETVRIVRLGAQGDGVAETDTGPVYVPFALPGEAVAIAREKTRGTPIALRETAASRVEPPCPHFGPDGEGGPCGGCALQHMADGAYRDWKRGLVAQALAARGLSADIGPLVPCPPAARRRVTFTARRIRGGVLLGFMAAGSHRIVDLDCCTIAHPAIVGELAAIRRIAGALAPGTQPFRVTVLHTPTGLDIAASGLSRLSERQRRTAVETALAVPAIARLAADGETLIEPRKPVLAIGDAAVTPPPGAFVQATAQAEARMAALVTGHLAGARQVADLFAGIGTFALRLARQANVRAMEGEAAALDALDAARRHAGGLKEISTERRDLFRRPPTGGELKAFDGLVFDPPRAGAEAVSRALAAAPVARVAAVSCNPATLARDLRILVDGGYRIETVQPVDQFLWSAHVEVVALLSHG